MPAQRVFPLLYARVAGRTHVLLQKLHGFRMDMPPFWSIPYIDPNPFSTQDVAAGRVAEGLALEFYIKFFAEGNQGLVRNADRLVSPAIRLPPKKLDIEMGHIQGRDVTAKVALFTMRVKPELSDEAMRDFAWVELGTGHSYICTQVMEAMIMAGAAIETDGMTLDGLARTRHAALLGNMWYYRDRPVSLASL